MKRRDLLGMGVGLFSAATLTACRTYEHLRYRLTVELSTPSGPYSGTTVREFVLGGKISWLPGGDNYLKRIYGEALTIELVGKTVFVPIIWWDDALIRTMFRFGRITPHIGAFEDVRWSQNLPKNMRALRRKKAHIELLGDDGKAMQALWKRHPQMVYFQRKNDPSSLKRLNLDNLERVLGTGTKISRYILEVTDDGVSMGIEKRLKWFPLSEAEERNLKIEALNSYNLNKLFVHKKVS